MPALDSWLSQVLRSRLANLATLFPAIDKQSVG